MRSPTPSATTQAIEPNGTQARIEAINSTPPASPTVPQVRGTRADSVPMCDDTGSIRPEGRASAQQKRMRANAKGRRNSTSFGIRPAPSVPINRRSNSPSMNANAPSSPASQPARKEGIPTNNRSPRTRRITAPFDPLASLPPVARNNGIIRTTTETSQPILTPVLPSPNVTSAPPQLSTAMPLPRPATASTPCPPLISLVQLAATPAAPPSTTNSDSTATVPMAQLSAAENLAHPLCGLSSSPLETMTQQTRPRMEIDLTTTDPSRDLPMDLTVNPSITRLQSSLSESSEPHTTSVTGPPRCDLTAPIDHQSERLQQALIAQQIDTTRQLVEAQQALAAQQALSAQQALVTQQVMTAHQEWMAQQSAAGQRAANRQHSMTTATMTNVHQVSQNNGHTLAGQQAHVSANARGCQPDPDILMQPSNREHMEEGEIDETPFELYSLAATSLLDNLAVDTVEEVEQPVRSQHYILKPVIKPSILQ